MSDVQIFSVIRKVSSWLQLSNLGDAIDRDGYSVSSVDTDRVDLQCHGIQT